MTASQIEIPSPLTVQASLRNLAEKRKKGQSTAEENATLDQQFVALAAVYNDLMYREHEHRLAYNCSPDWKCKCPVHKELSSASSHNLWGRVRYLDPDFRDGNANGALSAPWWEKRGFQLVLPGTDPIMDWVLLANGEVPVLPGIVEKAASWWVNFLIQNLPGKVRPYRDPTFAMYEPTTFNPIDWTPDLQSRLQAELVTRLQTQFAARKAPEAFAPLEVELAPYGGSMNIFEACRKVGIGSPVVTNKVTMELTPASIKIEHTVWET